MADKPYREAVGSIQNAVNTTRPDIAFSVNRLAAFLQSPGPPHWKAVPHLLAYLKGILDYKITYCCGAGSGIRLMGCKDADYAADPDTRGSTSGEVFMMSGGPVSWSSKKQATVALECVALTRSAKQATWMYSFLEELRMPQERPAGDNTGLFGHFSRFGLDGLGRSGAEMPTRGGVSFPPHTRSLLFILSRIILILYVLARQGEC